jgi:hypothetical protein
MNKLDPFTKKRLIRFVENFRFQSGQIPTLRDFDAAGFGQDQVELGIKDGFLEQYYVTLSNGTIVKAYKLRVTSR